MLSTRKKYIFCEILNFLLRMGKNFLIFHSFIIIIIIITMITALIATVNHYINN